MTPNLRIDTILRAVNYREEQLSIASRGHAVGDLQVIEQLISDINATYSVGERNDPKSLARRDIRSRDILAALSEPRQLTISSESSRRAGV